MFPESQIFILRSGSNQTKELLKAMDEDVLPEFLGGKCKYVPYQGVVS
jgi:hypothetical protein